MCTFYTVTVSGSTWSVICRRLEAPNCKIFTFHRLFDLATSIDSMWTIRSIYIGVNVQIGFRMELNFQCLWDVSLGVATHRCQTSIWPRLATHNITDSFTLLLMWMIEKMKRVVILYRNTIITNIRNIESQWLFVLVLVTFGCRSAHLVMVCYIRRALGCLKSREASSIKWEIR